MHKEYVILSDISKRRIVLRRICLFGVVLLSVVFATMKWASFMPTDVILPIRIGMIFLFCITFAWISLFFWSSVFGFVELLRHRKMPGIKRVPYETKLTTRTAILMPVYNEDPTSVFANLLAMARDLEKTGQEQAFDFFVLSDTTKPSVWIQEEALWMHVKELFPKNIQLYYRHRAKNTARKSGNIEDFCVRWGANYDHMIVLDADSLMAAETVVKMAQFMEVNTTTGIIQAPPMIINRHTFFARIQQFAGRVYGPIISAGLAYWQVWDSNYWGHNAIIRTRAFMECCGLPVFPGQAPFGGHILSHDFVEAALIRRGGWLAWMLPELKGSYEDCPPSMLDFAIRDRRWCQGNLQHLRILFSRKLHPVSRLHFTLGIMSYLSSPLWFLFLVLG
ncbi:MAG: glucans biosynthesis glucosyltransferase MdoH, partial [Alphaproteobacteria bacterium]|nr:glucans biosynthesis glucosyltransferase MdoH [Alphaproteobacteria bacterium]